MGGRNEVFAMRDGQLGEAHLCRVRPLNPQTWPPSLGKESDTDEGAGEGGRGSDLRPRRKAQRQTHADQS